MTVKQRKPYFVDESLCIWPLFNVLSRENSQEVAWSLVYHDIFVTTPCFQRKVSTLSTFWTPAPTLEAPQVAGADGPLSFDTLTSSSHPRRAASRSAPRPSPSVRQPLSGPGRTASLASALTASSSLQ